MMKLAWLALLVAACGHDDHASRDKCERVYDRMTPLFEQDAKPHTRDAEIKACRDSLVKSPGREVWLDCILTIEGDLSTVKLKQCEKLDKEAIRTNRSEPHVLQGSASSAP